MPKLKKQLPSAERIRELLYYDPITGDLIKKKYHKRWRRGYVLKGLKFAIDGQRYYVYRLIWKMMTGEDPLDTVDHRDGNRRNNKWSNLREASHTQQSQNKPRSDNNRYIGVTKFREDSYKARICVDKKLVWSRVFKTLEEAIEERIRLEELYQGEYSVRRSRNKKAA